MNFTERIIMTEQRFKIIVKGKNADDSARTGNYFKCPKCGKECTIDEENKISYKYKCVHCLIDYVVRKND